jgi:hypothetical protein
MRAVHGEACEALHRHPPHDTPAASITMVTATGSTTKITASHALKRGNQSLWRLHSPMASPVVSAPTLALAFSLSLRAYAPSPGASILFGASIYTLSIGDNHALS